jgi:hypothetical protein
MIEEPRDDVTTPAAPACPRCGLEAIPVVYGYPSSELREAVEQGSLALGGCLVGDGDPEWTCANGHWWR